MGNLIFWILHIFALIFGFVFLFITIPAHLIYCAIRARRSGEPRKNFL
jgi:heme/copper-type cytochrome/quinol oxidase subunit 2